MDYINKKKLGGTPSLWGSNDGCMSSSDIISDIISVLQINHNSKPM